MPEVDRLRRMSKLFLPALFAALVLTACGGSSPGSSASVTPTTPAAPDTLSGTSWKAITVAGQAVVVGHEPTATFTAAEVAGTTGCNSYGGGYTYADGKIAFMPLRMTMMGCIGPIGEVEGRFTAAMSGATTAAVDAQGQLIIDGAAGAIVFVPFLT
jgi:heat shock protein HslJ